MHALDDDDIVDEYGTKLCQVLYYLVSDKQCYMCWQILRICAEAAQGVCICVCVCGRRKHGARRESAIWRFVSVLGTLNTVWNACIASQPWHRFVKASFAHTGTVICVRDVTDKGVFSLHRKWASCKRPPKLIDSTDVERRSQTHYYP